MGLGANPVQCPLCSGLQALGQTFGANPAFASSLRYLDLSKNPGLLATDEANVSPQNSLSPLKKACSSFRSWEAFCPMASGGGETPSSLPLQPLYPSCSRPSTVSWPNPMLWCTWTCQELTASSTW